MSASNAIRRFLTTFTLGTALLSQIANAAGPSVDTKYGTVELEQTPQRVITLYEGALDAAVAVGVEPLGAVVTRGGQGVAPYIQDSVPAINIVGTSRETNLEAVIALQPDLILAAPTLNQEQYQLLSSVAPTIVPDIERYQSDSWKNESLVYARAMDKQAEMNRVLGDIAQETAALKNRLAQVQSDNGNKAVLMRWMPQGAMLMAPGIFASTLLESAGFELEDSGLIKPGRPHSSPLSQEKLDVIDQDWLFMATLNDDGQKAMDAAKTSPAFSRLEVVKQERAFPVDGTLWTSASGPLAAREVLRQLETLVQGQAE